MFLSIVLTVALAGVIGIEIALQRKSKTPLRAALRAQTIPQILIVVAVIAGLAFLGFGSVYTYQQWNGATVCKSNLKTYQAAIESYNVAVGSYPASIAAITVASLDQPATTQSYLGNLPQDPMNPNKAYAYTLTAAGSGTTNATYTISCPGTHAAIGLAIAGVAGAATKGEIEIDQAGAYTAI
jgi:type II secretory pathway pseudopilin PulG